MSRDKSLLIERNEAIKAKYDELAKKTIKDKKGREIELYRREAILIMLSKRFWLSPVTIDNILSAPEEPTNQLELFEE
ncbi:MAG TPA: hypothetical protein VN698_12955 [Bacteroidia bacterium]|nr:hypothetical protein [Bacteroidia bacterium]